MNYWSKPIAFCLLHTQRPLQVWAHLGLGPAVALLEDSSPSLFSGGFPGGSAGSLPTSSTSSIVIVATCHQPLPCHRPCDLSPLLLRANYRHLIRCCISMSRPSSSPPVALLITAYVHSLRYFAFVITHIHACHPPSHGLHAHIDIASSNGHAFHRPSAWGLLMHRTIDHRYDFSFFIYLPSNNLRLVILPPFNHQGLVLWGSDHPPEYIFFILTKPFWFI